MPREPMAPTLSEWALAAAVVTPVFSASHSMAGLNTATSSMPVKKPKVSLPPMPLEDGPTRKKGDAYWAGDKASSGTGNAAIVFVEPKPSTGGAPPPTATAMRSPFGPSTSSLASKATRAIARSPG